MGQVFTWDSIQAGRIPKQESFHRVASMLREALSKNPAIISALLFGSVVRGDFNIRSDIDCVVIYDTRQETWAMLELHDIDQIAYELHVPINFTPCDTVLAKTRLHHLGVSFVRHLQASIDAGGLIKGSLVDLLAPTAPAEQEIESYIKMKMFSMQTAFAKMASFNEEGVVRFLRKALEASTHVARKMLIYEGTLGGDSKKEVQMRYGETMPTYLSDLFDHLIGIDSWYSSQLELQLKTPIQTAYMKTLAELQTELPVVLEFLRSNILRLNAR